MSDSPVMSDAPSGGPQWQAAIERLVEVLAAPRAPALQRIGPRWDGCEHFAITDPAAPDTWFIQAEARLPAARVPVGEWCAALAECLLLANDIKLEFVRELEGDYDAFRKAVLRRYEPRFPTDYYTQKLSMVRGTRREDVRQRLARAKKLRDRAARDEGRDGAATRGYPFINAFPDETRERLRNAFSVCEGEDAAEVMRTLFALAPDDPRALIAAAPSKDTLDTLLEPLREVVAVLKTFTSKPERLCFECGRAGHVRANCPRRRRPAAASPPPLT